MPSKTSQPPEPEEWEKARMAAEEQAVWNRIEQSFAKPRGVRVKTDFEVTEA